MSVRLADDDLVWLRLFERMFQNNTGGGGPSLDRFGQLRAVVSFGPPRRAALRALPQNSRAYPAGETEEIEDAVLRTLQRELDHPELVVMH
jgi:hypothetical protein